jgi:hypothetical protein
VIDYPPVDKFNDNSASPNEDNESPLVPIDQFRSVMSQVPSAVSVVSCAVDGQPHERPRRRRGEPMICAGGVISGDRVDVDFAKCQCGQYGPTIGQDSARYADLGGDKIGFAARHQKGSLRVWKRVAVRWSDRSIYYAAHTDVQSIRLRQLSSRTKRSTSTE